MPQRLEAFDRNATLGSSLLAAREEDTVDRLGRLALVWAGLFGMSVVFQSLVGLFVPLVDSWELLLPRAVGAAFGALLGLACRRHWLPHRRLLELGLAFEVIGALVIALTELMIITRWPGRFVGFSFIVVWMLLFRIFLPSSVPRALVGGLLCATALPAVYGVADLALGVPIAWLGPAGVQVAQVYVFAGVSVLVARVLSGWQRAADQAAELGSYRLGAQVGEGGMGTVWRARHQMLKRDAAIKLIRPAGLVDPVGRAQARARFEREARATAALQSVHTVQIYDFGETRDGAFYYVMELLDGLDFQRLVGRHGRQPAERVVHLLRGACHSLEDAHRQGIVHRDIKPANLFACRLGPDLDFVKVMDFGLAALSPGSELADATSLTADGAICGTPAFMPPEVAGGGMIDPRTDLYMLGCVGYWLLTGALVFEHGTAMGMVAAHLRDAPAPPSSRGAGDCPPALERAILDCLAKDPAARPGSAGELARRLAAVPLVQPWTPERAADWWAEHGSAAAGEAHDPFAPTEVLTGPPRVVSSLVGGMTTTQEV